MRRLITLLTVAVMLAATTDSAFAAMVYNVSVPVGPENVGNPVTNACNGDPIALSGFVHDLGVFTEDSNGGLHITERRNLEDVAGVDEVTGASYRLATANTMTLNAASYATGGYPQEASDLVTIELIGKGSAPNFLLHALFHETFTPEGTVTADISFLSTECK